MSQEPPKRSAATPFLIGCGIGLLLLVLCGGGFALLGFRGWGAFQAGMEQVQEEEVFAQNWQAPPEDAPAEVFAPDSVAGYDLTTTDENAAFPALGIESEGHHAVYERGDDDIEVSVYRMNETERSRVFDEIIRRIDDGDRFRSHSTVRLTRSLAFSVNPPELRGKLLHAGGWLVFVRSSTVDDLDPFLRAYLDAVERESTPAEASEDVVAPAEPPSTGAEE